MGEATITQPLLFGYADNKLTIFIAYEKNNEAPFFRLLKKLKQQLRLQAKKQRLPVVTDNTKQALQLSFLYRNK